ncbi:hypothetical protein CVS40_12841 [Lucilia cuprina]|nr:hypothetical protein CVS40_12841 [Lucilia cuprina]
MVFLNDFIKTLTVPESQIFIYVDDVLFKHDKYFNDVLQSNINFNMNWAQAWFNTNNVKVNINKSRAMVFNNFNDCVDIKMGVDSIIAADSIKCLGVTLDKYLRFDKHINTIFAKITFMLKRLYNIGRYLPTNVRVISGHTILMPHILYCLEFIEGCSIGEHLKLRRVTRRIIRYVYKLHVHDNTSFYENRFLGCSFPSLIFGDYCFIRLSNIENH